MRPAASTSFDIAIWLLDRARAEDTYLQPRMLQCLLFVAQAHFAAAHDGRPLMPAFFVVDDSGPLDPNVYRTLQNGRPDMVGSPLDPAIVTFLGAVWTRYKNADALRLDQLIARRGVDEEAVCNRDQSEVTLVVMQRMFGTGHSGKNRNKISGPTVAETATGRKVTITKWTPARKKSPR